MPTVLQNFYKEKVLTAWGAGAGNFYVTNKPVPTEGYLVVSPADLSKREILWYSAIGNDIGGDFITVALPEDRGLGGTTAQTHSQDEPVRMNITAQHWDDLNADIDAKYGPGSIVPNPTLPTDPVPKSYVDTLIELAASLASTILMGISRLSASPNVSIGTATITIASPAVITHVAHGLTTGDVVQFTTSGTLPTGIIASTNYFVITTGLTADAFEISSTFAGSAITTTGSQSGTHTLIKTTPVSVGLNDPRLPTQSENDAMVSNDASIAVGTGNRYISETGLQKRAPVYGVSTGSATNTISGNPTITIASPAVITLASHGLAIGDAVQFTTTGALPTGLVVSTTYYVIATGFTTGAFQLSTTLGGSAITTTGSQSGTHTALRPANNYTLAISPVPTSYAVPMEIEMKANYTNTGVATVNLNGLGSISIIKGVNTPIIAGDIIINQICNLKYNGTSFILTNPSTITSYAEQLATLGTSVIGNAASAVVSKTDGTEICFAHQNPGINNTSWTIGRMAQDTVTGTWYLVETTTFTAGTSNSIAVPGLTYVGAFIFFSVYDSGATTKNLYRFSATNLTAGATAFTYSGTSPNAAGQSMYTNGTDLIIYGGSTNWYRYTLSGTVATNAATLTGPAAAPAINFDGTNVYMYDGVTLSKYAVTLGSATATLTRSSFYFGSNSHFAGIQFINSQALNVISTGVSGQNLLFFTPITKI